jgi:hypothetical protein
MSIMIVVSFCGLRGRTSNPVINATGRLEWNPDKGMIRERGNDKSQSRKHGGGRLRRRGALGLSHMFAQKREKELVGLAGRLLELLIIDSVE